MVAAVGLVRAAPGAERGAVQQLLALLDEPLDALRRGDHVLIKPNAFQTRPGFHSNPAVIAAIAAAAAERGARVTVAERTRAIYHLLSETEVAKYAEITSFDDQSFRFIQIEGARSLRVPIAVPEIVLDCDYFIGVPHLRTHSSMVLTGAMKNLIGLLPGFTTRIVHMAGVSESIVDLNLMRPQDLVVADVTTVVEGNYPMAGSLRPVGVLAGGRDAGAVDTVLAQLSGVEPDELAYLVEARGRGLVPERIQLRGVQLREVAFPIRRAPASASPGPRVHVHADSACPACRRWIAAALTELHDELAAYPGELTVVAGPREHLPRLRGAVVLVGNDVYEHRDAGIYLEGCPPRAIQLAGIRYALGQPVTPEQRSQFRVPGLPPAMDPTRHHDAAQEV